MMVPRNPSGGDFPSPPSPMEQQPDGSARTPRRGRSARVTREMILAAALKEFSEQGFEGATTASIARRVGVTQPLVHYHFGSKDTLWRATVDGLFSRLLAQIDESERQVQGMGPAARLVTLSYLFVDFVAANPEYTRLLNSEGGAHTPRLVWLVDTYIRPLFDRWSSYLDDAKSAGIIKDIPNAFLLFALLGACNLFFDLAPMAREVYGIAPRSPQVSKAYANAMMEQFLEGAALRRDNGS